MNKAKLAGALIAVALVAFATGATAQITTAVEGETMPVPATPGYVVVPRPDPTSLTTDQLRREIAALRELIEARLDGSDKAVKLLQEATDRQPANIRDAVEQLQALDDEKFSSIATQFQERDVRTEQAAATTKVAVDAALQAAEKAVNAALANSSQITAKSEASTTKQIEALSAQFGQGIEAIRGTVDDLKARVQAIESRSEGQSVAKQDSSENWGFLFGIGGLLIAALMAVFAMTRTHATRERAT